MENVTRALMIAFSMLIFVIAFTYSMYLINKLTTTSSTLLETVSTTNYYDNIQVSGDVTTREVGVDTIIPVLYRYYKENYAVKILDSEANGGKLIQLFDVNIESKIDRAAKYTVADVTSVNADKELISLKSSIYNIPNNKAYLFEAPWTGSTSENTRARIDYFLHGTKGYINNTLVDYTQNSKTGIFQNENGFIGNYGNTTFIESFVEYAYEGETISTETGVETITGSTKESSKIIITYQVK